MLTPRTLQADGAPQDQRGTQAQHNLQQRHLDHGPLLLDLLSHAWMPKADALSPAGTIVRKRLCNSVACLLMACLLAYHLAKRAADFAPAIAPAIADGSRQRLAYIQLTR